MERRTLGLASLSLLALPLALNLSACSDDSVGATGSFSSGGTVGDGDGDPSGSETNGNSAGDGDGDPGDGDPGDGDPGDGDGDPGDGDGDGDAPCVDNSDCPDPGMPVCDGMGECVPCTPADDPCAVGQYCDDTNTCVVGCIEDDDCPMPLVCDVDANECTGCVEDMNCPLGSVCDAGNCVPGCTDQQPCQNGFSCCSGDCQDLAADPNNCGMCGNVCPDYPNADDVCDGGICELGPCQGNWHDCDGQPQNGCETQANCACMPGEQVSCYTGFPANTEGVGQCVAGLRTCNNQGTGFGACIGQVIPGVEICGNNLDENCDGQVDENPDLDNDGWGVCDNDCCDQVSPSCSTPNLVNPGAFEVGGNMVDDDCDGMIDNPLPLCDNNLAANNANALDYARAVDLCQFTVENPPLPQRIWGVISGGFFRGNGTGAPNASSRSIRPQFGSVITPQLGQRLAVMSSGYASYPGAPAPGYVAFQGGADMTGSDTTAPADWLAAHGNAFPNAPGCPGAGSTTAFDGIMLKLRVRVPTNANSFSTKMYFFSAEYPEYVCTTFNDLFISLVDSTDNGNPNDKNIAIYAANNQTWPVGVNLVSAAPGLFRVCDNGNIGCAGGPNVPYNGCSAGEGELLGTGFDVAAAACLNNNDTGGGTGWLTMSGNVTPGETMEIRFVIWDTGDSVWDSLVLLDNWQWSVQAATPGVSPG